MVNSRARAEKIHEHFVMAESKEVLSEYFLKEIRNTQEQALRISVA